MIKNKEGLTYASVSFQNIPELIKEFKQQLASACKAPVSRILGETSNEDEDNMNYVIDYLSEYFYRDFLNVLIPLTYKSITGKDIKHFSFTFKSLDNPTEIDKANKMKTAMEMISIMWKDGVLNQSSYFKNGFIIK